MDETEFDRYFRKMRNLMREGTHIARINDLLARIKAKLPELEELRWAEEEGVYRFYHHSFKVFYLQDQTREGFKLTTITAAFARKANRMSHLCQ